MVYILIFMVLPMTTLSCTRSDDCGWCGYCVQKTDSLSYSCYYPFQRFTYSTSPTECHSLSLCSVGNVCKNKARCIDGYGYQIPTCVCDKSKYFGEYCQNTISDEIEYEFASGFGVFFSQSKGVVINQISLYVTATYAGAGFKIYVSTSEGYEVIISSDQKNPEFKVELRTYKLMCGKNKKCYDEFILDRNNYYTALLDFPYKRPTEKNVLKLKNLRPSEVAAGYLAQVHVVVKPFRMSSGSFVGYTTDHTLFSYNFQVMVDFNNLGYRLSGLNSLVPIIEISHCPRFSKDSEVYFSSVAIGWDSKISNPDAKLTWTVLFMPIEHPPRQHKMQHINVVTRGSKRASWTIPPFFLKAGRYKLRLLATVVTATQSLNNFKDCYFEVQNRPLIAYLEGGDSRVVGKKEGILISGWKSHDPNEPLERQGHLSFLWTCSPECSDIMIMKFSGKTMQVKPDDLTVDKLYTFTLTVSAPGRHSEFASQQVLVKETHEGGSFSIQCLANCMNRVIPTDVLLLQVKTSVNFKVSVDYWAYYVLSDVDKTKHSVETIYDDSYPSHLLCIKPNSLDPGKIYQFEISDGKVSASIKLQVDSKPRNGSCEVSPLSGTITETLFNIKCSGFVHDDKIIVYEYYNKYKNEPVEAFNGRMLGKNHVGSLYDIQLTREVVVIFIYSMYGVPAISTHDIVLKREPQTQVNIESNLTEIKTIAQSGNFDETIRQLGEVIDLLPKNEDRNVVLSKSIDILEGLFINKQTIEIPVSQLKSGLLSLSNVLFSPTFKEQVELQPATSMCFTRFVRLLCKLFKSLVQKISIPYINNMILEEITRHFIDIIEKYLLVHKTITLYAQDINQMDPETFNNIQEIETNLLNGLKDVTYGVSFRQSEYLTPLNVESNSTLSRLTVLCDSSLAAGVRVNRDDKFPINLSKSLLSRLRVADSLTVQSTTMRVNPASLPLMAIGDGDLATDLVNVELFSKMHQSDGCQASMAPITILGEPLDLYLDVKTSYEHGTVTDSITKLDIDFADQDDLDARNVVKVIRIDVPERCKMFVKFVLNDTSDDLRVKSEKLLRPSYEQLMATDTKIVNSSFSSYEVPYEVVDERQFMYIGVLPGPSTAVGKTVNFTVEYFCYTCLARSRRNWITHVCSVGDETNSSTIHCRCNHLSFFSSVFVVPPRAIDPFNDFPLFLSIVDNPYVVLFVVGVSVFFILLCVLAIFKDIKESAARQVIVLEDNFPDDKCFYVVAVFTGSRLLSGTDATVGIKISGSGGRSRAHVLKSRSRQVMRTDEDDWFLIRTPAPLGTITDVHIWHDNAGWFPDWYCEKVLLYDMAGQTVYTFIAEECIAIGSNEYPEAVLFPATADNFRSMGTIFLENVRHGMMHCHLLASILTRHRDVKTTKLDRVVIVWTIVMTASLVGIAFYKVRKSEYEGVDKPYFSAGTKTVVEGLEIFLVNALFIAMFQQIFKSSYRLENPKSYKEYKIYERGEKVEAYRVFNVYLRPDKRAHMTCYEKFVRKIYKIYRPLRLCPVVLFESSQVFSRKPVYFVLAWTSAIITIILCSYFIILYGIKMGKVKSKDWIANIVVAIVNHFAVLVPIKIVLVAVILASHFVNLVPISNYKIKTGNTVQILNVENVYRTVLEKRKSCVYQPLNTDTTFTMRRRRAIRNLFWKAFTIYVNLSVIFVLYLTCKWGYQYFHSNHHTKSLVKAANVDYSYLRTAEDITNKTEFLIFLSDIFFHSGTLYRKKWYNGYSLSPPHLQDTVSWADDCTHQLVGPPVLRQLRVVPNVGCTVNDMLTDVIHECIPAWSTAVQDTDEYAYEWSAVDWSAADVDTAWTYRTPSESAVSSSISVTVTGISYPKGGYIAVLGKTRFDTFSVLPTLVEGGWIDQYTRVTFCTFTLYDVNTRTFTQVRLAAEHLPTGLYLTKIQAKSVQLTTIKIAHSCVFILYVVALFLFDCILIYRYGIKFFLTKFNYWFQIVLILLGTLTVASIATYLYVATSYIAGFDVNGTGDVFNFDMIVWYQYLSHASSIVLFVGLVVRLFTLWHYGRIYKVTLTTMRIMFPTLVVVCVWLVVLCYVHWNILNLNGLFEFSKRDCLLRWSVTLEVEECLHETPENTNFYMLKKITSYFVLLYLLTVFKVEKNRADTADRSYTWQ